MNRRSFLKNSALALFGFTILPSAGRIWKATPKIVTPPFWSQTTRYACCYDAEYLRLLTDKVTGEFFEKQMVHYYQENYAH